MWFISQNDATVKHDYVNAVPLSRRNMKPAFMKKANMENKEKCVNSRLPSDAKYTHTQSAHGLSIQCNLDAVKEAHSVHEAYLSDLTFADHNYINHGLSRNKNN